MKTQLANLHRRKRQEELEEEEEPGQDVKGKRSRRTAEEI
jgi:hypothetical protein